MFSREDANAFTEPLVSPTVAVNDAGAVDDAHPRERPPVEEPLCVHTLLLRSRL
jgi:hypothetical protein